MANSKIDNQMERMQFLMEYKTAPKVDTKAGIEYKINTADGKTYGIIRENSMYYIKTTTPDKADIKESYEYIGGHNYRNEHGYKSFNEAVKHLELEVMCINEAQGKHEDVSVLLNPNKGKEDMKTLTEAARTELDRMHQIFENSGKIGHYNNPFSDTESKGKASAENTTKNNSPFTDKAEATLDKDPKFNGTVDGATPDNKKVSDSSVNSDLQSDKMKTANSGSEKDNKAAHDDLEGEGVADKNPSGAKAVKMNESVLDGSDELTDDALSQDNFTEDDFNTEGDLTGEPIDDLAGFQGETPDDEFDSEEDIDSHMFGDDSENEFNDGEEDLDALLNEILDVDLNVTGQNSNGDNATNDTTANVGLNGLEESEECCGDNCKGKCGGEAVLKGSQKLGGKENTINGAKTMDRMDEDSDNQKPEGACGKESKLVGPDKVMDGPHGSLDAQTWDKLQESIDRITDSIYNRLTEGQGWNKFKDIWSRRNTLPQNDKEYDELFTNDYDVDNWVENGGRDNSLTSMDDTEIDAPYYDNNGDATDRKYDKNGMRNGQIGTGFMDRLGRKSAVTAAKAISKGRIAANKFKNKNRMEENLQEAINRLVAEEVTKLDAWGKHPRYQKPAFKTPDNHEVSVNGAEDWNDDSTKGSEAYGKKIGSSAPFDKQVDMLTDAVVNYIKENYGLKKK